MLYMNLKKCFYTLLMHGFTIDFQLSIKKINYDLYDVHEKKTSLIKFCSAWLRQHALCSNTLHCINFMCWNIFLVLSLKCINMPCMCVQELTKKKRSVCQFHIRKPELGVCLHVVYVSYISRLVPFARIFPVSGWKRR